jgi:hypothetical protein
MLTSLH